MTDNGQVPTPDELRAISDVEERARAAGAAARSLRDLSSAVVGIRDEAIEALLADGRRPGEVGEIAQVSKTQMVRYGKRT